MDIQLRLFIDVVNCGSFTKAAMLNGKKKEQISRAISKLEQQLGVRLLERNTRSLTVTEIGADIYEQASGVVQAIDNISAMAQNSHASPNGILRLTSPVEFGIIAVNKLINLYLEAFPDVKVEANYSNTLSSIIDDGYDLSIRIGHLSDSNLIARKLGNISYGLYASPEYLDGHGNPAVPALLPEHQLLVFVTGISRMEWKFTKGGEELSLSFSPKLLINNLFAVRDACIDGLGIAKLPTIVAQEALQSGRLVQILPEWKMATVPINGLYPSTRYLTQKVRAFMDLAVENLKGF